MATCQFPIAVLSFNRPHYLAEVLHSLRNQTIAIDQSRLYLFQDGAQSRFSQESADNTLHNECVTRFREIFPDGQILQSPVNLGIALNFDRAERLFFEDLEAECGLFFEDDLVLSPYYLEALLQLADFALAEPLVSYVAAYGEHTVPAERQRAFSTKIVRMKHNWGFALTRRQWLRQREFVDGYLSIVRETEYARRDEKRIAAYYASFGYTWDAYSQDAAKGVASLVLGTTRIMCFPCFGRYIGKEGTHFNEYFYNKYGYGKTEVFDGPPPQFAFPSRGELEKQISSERAFSLRLLAAKQQVSTQAIKASPKDRDEKYIYFGNLLPHEEQYKSNLFVGLALNPQYDKDISHDATQTFPFNDNSITGFQSQDVFEHIEAEKIPFVLDEVFRCLRPGGLFRLSLPDYNSPLLRRRSVYDCDGNVLCDLAMGGRVTASKDGGVDVSFSPGGGSHLWFPTYSKLLHLILSSQIRKCSSIAVHHAWIDSRTYVCNDFDQSIMPVARTPPRDMRAGGKPISIVIDFVK